LGRVLDEAGRPVGTCFQVAPTVLVTARHVLIDAGLAAEALVGAEASTDGLGVGVAPGQPAMVVAVDAVHDLAVLVRREPLPGTVGAFVASESLPLTTDVAVTGHAVLEGTAPLRHTTATGTWSGTAMRDDAVALARLSCRDLAQGMSGAPVVRLSDGAVVGVVSARYNPPDAWSQGTVWVARTEDVAAVLDGHAAVTLAGRVTATEPIEVTFTVTADSVHLFGGGVDVRDRHRGVSFGLRSALEDVRSARARAGTPRDGAVPEAGDAATSMRRVGELLTASFLPEPVRRDLAAVMGRAEESCQAVRFGVSLSGDAAAAGYGVLPWEALGDPVGGDPLALHRLVTVYRRAAAPAPRQVPGPLRIVVAIASPTDGGPVLDYERELRGVLAAVKGARAGAAQVRIVPFATTTAIKAALAPGDVHVLHVSAHGAPGRVILEHQDGTAHPVTAREFLAQAIPPSRMPPVIALAACYTNVADPTPSQDPENADEGVGEQAAVSFAADLVAYGAAGVVGTETSVTDRYATHVFAQIYTELAQAPDPDLVAAVAQARREVQSRLASSPDPRDRAVAGCDEWGVVTVLAGAGTLRVFDPTRTTPPVIGPVEPAVRRFAGLVARDPGQFVGRRRQQRLIPPLMLDGTGAAGAAGVVVTGIGGIGKTTLAAEVVRRCLERDPNLIVASITGATGVDAVLTGIGSAVRAALIAAGGDGAAAGVQIANTLARLDVGWADRAQVLSEYVLAGVPVLVVLDNFEDNLTGPGDGQPRQVRDEALGGLLATLAEDPGRGGLLVTCRYPFTLPDAAAARLRWESLGPLTFAETMKLVWALPNLDDLPDEDLERVWRCVGGHPRTLEYVDALLGHGQARLGDITTRLRDTIGAKLGPTAAAAWFAAGRGLDAAIADAITVAADDVLLEELLTALPPDATRLLTALSVFREPVDINAALYAIGEDDDTAAWAPDRGAAEQRILATLQTHGLAVDDLNTAIAAGDGLASLPGAVVEAIRPDLGELTALPRPPRSTTADLGALIGLLADSSLLSLDDDDHGHAVFVHRWTAGELARTLTDRGQAATLRAAHARAAAYWRWRNDVWPQDRQADVHDLLEARHHHHAAGEDDAADQVTQGICLQLDTWGALDHEHSLIVETRSWLGPDHPSEPAYLHHLGMLAQDRGDYEGAETSYRQSLTILERLGDQAGMASSYHQLGMLAQDRGDYEGAETSYRQSLTIFERLGDQAGMATTWSQMGILRTDQGRHAEATPLHIRALAVRLGIGVPQARIDVRALVELRTVMGPEVFAAEVATVLDAESAGNLMSLLNGWDDQPGQG
jgi:tetratricopeptide (TPR) repeat protein